MGTMPPSPSAGSSITATTESSIAAATASASSKGTWAKPSTAGAKASR